VKFLYYVMPFVEGPTLARSLKIRLKPTRGSGGSTVARRLAGVALTSWPLLM
jgi:hypothetical protein